MQTSGLLGSDKRSRRGKVNRIESERGADSGFAASARGADDFVKTGLFYSAPSLHVSGALVAAELPAWPLPSVISGAGTCVCTGVLRQDGAR